MNNDIIKLINSYGNSIVLIHSDILRGFKFDFINKKDYLNKHSDAIMLLFKNFDIWMPTFNYNFCRGEVFDINHTPSVLGVLNENFRQNISKWRTQVPVFSFAGTGNLPKIKSYKIIDPFGQDSAFDYLYNNNGLLVHYGSDLSSSTILHYAESKSQQLLYRYNKSFLGKVIDSNKYISDVNLTFHVRPFNRHLDYDFTKLENDLEINGILKKYIFQSTRLLFLPIKDLVDFIVYKMTIDPLYLLDKISNDWITDYLNIYGCPVRLSDFE
jgi:aminoglycoside 3-N-acetyltransferase